MSQKESWIQIDVGALPKNAPLRTFAPQPEPSPALLSIGVPVGGTQIEVPDLSAFPTARQKAVYLLGLAAGIEHALLAQYLYVAYSVVGAAAQPARKVLLQVAIEEMSHLMSVQNLLLLTGAPTTLRRADRQDLSADPIVPFDLTFEKLSKRVLARYIVTESAAFDPINDPLYPTLLQQAGAGHSSTIRNVGVLYGLLGVVFGSENVLNARAAAGNSAWDEAVKALADVIASSPAASSAYGGRAGMHLSDGDFQAGASNPFLVRHATDAMWDRSVRETSFRVFAPKSRTEALDTLRDISLQGEARLASAAAERSHFARFLEVYKTLYGEDGAGPELAEGIGDVPRGAQISTHAEDQGPQCISHREARPRARLAELRYWILLATLDQYLQSPPEDREFLVAWSMTEMYHLKMLGGLLAQLPRTLTGSGAAAIPFSMPPQLPSELALDATLVTGTRTQWPSLLQGWLQEAIANVDGLLPGVVDAGEKRLLTYMREVDRRKLVESTLRLTGSTARTTFDQVREILEWATGAGDPHHDQLGRFWNLPNADLKTATVYGSSLIEQQGAGSALVDRLQSGSMPKDRIKLTGAEHQPKIDAIKAWIDAGAKPDEALAEVGAVREIKEIRLLPTLSLARLGSSPQPMDNYTLELGNGQAYREIRAAETLVVNEQDGSIVAAMTPAEVKFKDALGRVKPVAPFLEVWALYDDRDELAPLTLRELGTLGLQASALTWTVRVANLKALRRTGQAGDRIAAQAEFSDHERHELLGRGDNLRGSQSIPLGAVRYVRPSAAFPEIRLRFTPAGGKVFGHAADANVPAGRAVYDPSNGTWDNHSDEGPNPTAPEPRARLSTSPRGIYATDDQGNNLGYLDDSCDGIVSVKLLVQGRELSAHARIAAGPPDFAPDSLPVRTVSDDLEQVMLGPDVSDVSPEEVLDIMRRGFETMRAAGLVNENRSFPFWVPAARNAFGTALDYTAAVAVHEQLLEQLRGCGAEASSPERALAHQALVRVAGAVRAFDEVANYANPGTSQSSGVRQMPALMRGADGQLLALTRRQRAKILLAVDKFRPVPATGNTPREALAKMITSLQFGAALHGAIATDTGPLSSVFADPEQVIAHLESGKVQGTLAATVPFVGQPLIVRGDPSASAFFQIINTAAHPMNSILLGYVDSVSNQNGVEILSAWIASLS